MVVAGNFTLTGPYEPDSEAFDHVQFESFEELLKTSEQEGIECDVDAITYETMDCIEDGFLNSFAHNLATRDCVAKGYPEDAILENDEALEYHVDRQNHYAEMFYEKGTDVLSIKETK